MASRSTTLSEVNVAQLAEQFGSSLVVEEDWIQIPRRALSSSDEDDIVSIPRNHNSLATLRYLGLSKEAASATWQRYHTSFLYNTDDIINFAKGTVRSGRDTDAVEDNEWIAAMRTMGASKELRTRIMIPEYQNIRLIKTPMAWVLQTMKERWLELMNMDNYVLGRSKSMDDEADDKKHLTVECVVQERTAEADEIHLFKGGAYARLVEAFQGEDLPGPRYVTLSIASLPPTDFSQGELSTYWTKDLELAEKFAGYAKARVAAAHASGILHMIVSKTIIQSAVQFRETSNWQEFVFVNSLRLPVPNHLAYLDNAEALIGPMVCESRRQILRRHLNGATYTSMQAFKLVGGAKAMQIAFRGRKIHDRLNVEARLWLEEWVEPTALQKKGTE
ncbi:hypothetical protein BDR22DRAFT_977122 [Usnea florida]